MKPGGGSSPDHNENPFFCEGNGAEKKKIAMKSGTEI